MSHFPTSTGVLHCPTCTQEVPEKQNLRMFAQYYSRPEDDNVEEWSQNLGHVLGYLAAVVSCLDEAAQKSKDLEYSMRFLAIELVREAQRQHDLLDTAAMMWLKRAEKAEALTKTLGGHHA